MRAASMRRRRHEEEEESAFVSMTDMTVGFLFIVILLLAFFASQYNPSEMVPRPEYEKVLTERDALAEELKDRGVTVNAVLPSIIDTPANRADMPDSDASRWVTPEALARVIAFLLSDDATPITGACLPVAGRV